MRKIYLIILCVILLFGMLSSGIGKYSDTTYRAGINHHGFYRVFNVTLNGLVPYENHTLNIHVGDTVVWINDIDDKSTIVSEQKLWNESKGSLKWMYKQFIYTFNQSGTYTFYIKERPKQKQTIIVNPIIAPTPKSAPRQTPKIIKLTPKPTPTPTIKPKLDISKSAELDINYTIAENRNNMTINVTIKNVGDATASQIDMWIYNPNISNTIKGAKKYGENITWNGSLKPNDKHFITFSVYKPENGLKIPLNVKYAKISPEEKAKILGIKPDQKLLTSKDWKVQSSYIKVDKQTPGFDIILVVTVLLLIYVNKRYIIRCHDMKKICK